MPNRGTHAAVQADTVDDSRSCVDVTGRGRAALCEVDFVVTDAPELSHR